MKLSSWGSIRAVLFRCVHCFSCWIFCHLIFHFLIWPFDSQKQTCFNNFNLKSNFLIFLKPFPRISTKLSSSKKKQQQQQRSSVRNSRVHQVRHLAGETALLPCEVRTAECGAVYFITWSRNTSQEWHRIFVYSKASQKPFYDTYNQLIGRPNRYSNQTQKLAFDASNLTADGFAYLRVDSVDDDDEGMFRCDVTYVKGKCPSLTYTQLSTIGKCISLLMSLGVLFDCPNNWVWTLTRIKTKKWFHNQIDQQQSNELSTPFSYKKNKQSNQASQKFK